MQNKRKIAYVLAVTSMFMTIPTEIVFATTEEIKIIENIDIKSEDMRIISSTEISKERAKNWAYQKGATQTFIELVDLYWSFYSEHGNINPGLAYVQAAIETGFGHFGGVLDEGYKNPCGLKNPLGGDDRDPNAHFKFNTWEEGVKAHLDHLALYAGAEGYPRVDTYDPRHFPYLLNTAKTVEELSSKWASDSNYGSKIIRNYNELIKVNKKESKMWVETPSQGVTLKNELEVSGWGLNDSGVKEVKAYIDGSYIKNLNNNITRFDVSNAYPNYTEGDKSGFEGIIDISDISGGNHTLRIDVVGKDNTVQSQYVSFNKEKKEKKESRMWVETPSQGVTLKNELEVSGWGLNDSGVKEVKAYIDGSYIKNLNNNIIRFDVSNAYPNYTEGDKSGFEGIIDISDISGGNHTLRIDVVGKDNTVQSQCISFNKEKKESRMWIETPTNYKNVEGKLKVSGWGLNDSGVKEVKAYINGNYIKNLENNITRFDVNNVYPGYTEGEKSGFEGSLDISNFATGFYDLRVDVIGNDNSIQSRTLKIKIIKKEIKGWIESPISGTKVVDETITVEGWALNDTGIKNINIYLNGSYQSGNHEKVYRSDVYNVYPEYSDSMNSGFKKEVNLKNILKGENTLKIEVIFNNGEKFIDIKSLNSLKPNIIDLNFDFDFGLEGPEPNNPDKIILHHAAGNSTAASVHNFHRFGNGWAGIGYHFYIHKDGTIYKGREENWRGAHAAEIGPNDGDKTNDTNATSIGIAVQGNYHPEKHIAVDKSMPKAQEDAVVELGQYLVEKYGITEVFKHGSPGIGHTSCPGNYYPFERIKARILSKYIYGVYNTEL